MGVTGEVEGVGGVRGEAEGVEERRGREVGEWGWG